MTGNYVFVRAERQIFVNKSTLSTKTPNTEVLFESIKELHFLPALITEQEIQNYVRHGNDEKSFYDFYNIKKRKCLKRKTNPFRNRFR